MEVFLLPEETTAKVAHDLLLGQMFGDVLLERDALGFHQEIVLEIFRVALP